MASLKQKSKYVIAVVSLLCHSLAFANTDAWYLFSQGTSPNPTDVKNVSNIEVLSEKLSVQVNEKEDKFPFPKNPSAWLYFLKQGTNLSQIKTDVGSGKIWTMPWNYIDKESGTYLSGTTNSTDTQVTAIYKIHNISKKAISIDTGFSFFNKMEENHGGNDLYCPDYVEVGDDLLPQNFQISDGKNVIPSTLEFINRAGTIKCMTNTGSGETENAHPMQWVLPAERYTLSLKPQETKTLTITYKTHLFDYGVDFQDSKAIFYDFEPIFSWGKGKVGKVDIVVIYPRNYESRFTKGDNYTMATEKYTGKIKPKDNSIEEDTKIDTIKPTSIKLLANNSIQNTYSYKNLTIDSGMKALRFSFRDTQNHAEFGAETYDKTFGLSCTTPKGKTIKFTNSFPNGKPTHPEDFIGYARNDTKNGLLITKMKYGKDLFTIEYIGKSTLLPVGTNCSKN